MPRNWFPCPCFPKRAPVPNETPQMREWTDEERRTYDHSQILFKWILNCTDDEDMYRNTSVVTDPRLVLQPLEPVGTPEEYMGAKINKMSTADMVSSIRRFFAYQTPGAQPVLDNNPDWIMFEHGTFVVIPDLNSHLRPSEDVRAEGVRLMQQRGPVLLGDAAGDVVMTTVKPHIHNGAKGWIVFGVHPIIGTFVGENELKGMTHETCNEPLVALYGREKRHLDSISLVVVHEETAEILEIMRTLNDERMK